MEDQLSIFIVSDSLGETARALAKACIYQFPIMTTGNFAAFPILIESTCLIRFLKKLDKQQLF